MSASPCRGLVLTHQAFGSVYTAVGTEWSQAISNEICVFGSVEALIT